MIRIEDYENDYNEFSNELNNLYKQQNASQENSIQGNSIETLKSFLGQDFIKIYNSCTRKEKRRIWLSAINYIVLDDNYNMKIFFI